MKKLTELNTNEVTILWNRNSKLHDLVLHYYNNDKDLFVEEYIGCFPNGALESFEFGLYVDSHLYPKDNKLFLDGLENLQDKFNVFELHEQKELNELQLIVDFLNLNIISEDAYNVLATEVFERLGDLAHSVVKFIQAEYTDDEEELKYYLVNFMFDWMEEIDGFYIDNDYILYKKIVECYK
jgi:hypothetical protein